VLLALIAGSVLACAGLESAARVRMWQRGVSWSNEGARAALESLRGSLVKLDWRPGEEQGADADAAAPTGLILHPYHSYDTAAGQSGYARTAALMQSPRGAESTHVVVLGGSVSCVLVAHARDRMARALGEHERWGGRPVRIHVLGQGGMKQPQQSMALAYALALGWKPDLVINVDGFNEVALGNQNADMGAHPLHPTVHHWSHLVRGGAGIPEVEDLRAELIGIRQRTVRLLDLTLQGGLYRSAVIGYSMRQHAQERIGTYRALQGDYVLLLSRERHPSLHGPPFVPGLESVLRSAVISWQESSTSIAAMCATRGITYLHVLQPTLHDAGSKPLTAREVAMGTALVSWKEGCRVGYPMLRAAGEALSRRGVNFLDASMLFADVEEQLYYDACHFNEHGSFLLADAITAELRKQRP
jgi:hypothetical protein